MIAWSVDDVTREAARRAAREELARPEYHRDDPSLTERLVDRAYEAVSDLVRTASDNTPGGGLGLVGILLLVVLLAVLLRLRVGAFATSAARSGDLFGGGVRSAAEHRAAAEAAAAAGQWADAVRERLRALVRGLEERTVLEPRAGRTADEAAAEAGRMLPGVGPAVTEAVRVFDEIWYGARPATADGYARVRAADEAVAAARPVLTGSSG